jgi:hypothetical protein
MNAYSKRVPTRFGAETRFELRPASPAPFRAIQETAFDELKNRLLRDALGELTQPALNGYLRRAANDAAALAWVTPFPLLVFPALFDEKAEAARLQGEKQASVRRRSLELLTV